MAVRDLATLTLKTLMRQSPARTALVSARNAASQAKVARLDDGNVHGKDTVSENGQSNMAKSTETDYVHIEDTVPNTDRHEVYITNTEDCLNINLENVSASLQKELIDKLGLFLTADSDLQTVPNVRFNSITEGVYRQSLYMPFRKLGYDCMFTRFNHDRGLATFKLEDSDTNAQRSYFRSQLPNRC